MSKHTPEPWIYIGNGDIVARSENYCGGEKDIASVFLTVNDEDEENASRIVACVNACAGLPTKWLKKNRIQDRWSDELKSAPKCNGEFVRGSEFQAICDQRNQLLEALDHIAQTIDRQLELIADRAKGDFLDKRPVVQSLQSHARRARAAIAKATGGNNV